MMIHFVEENGKILLHFLVLLWMFVHFHFKLLDMIPNPELLSGFIKFSLLN